MRIKQSILYNILGFGVSTAVMLLSYPALLRGMGVVQFGLFTLAISFSSSFSILDLGVSSGAIRFIAYDVSRRAFREAADVIVTSLVFYSIIGFVIALIVLLLAPWFAAHLSESENVALNAEDLIRIASLQVVVSMFVGTIANILKSVDRFNFATILTCSLSTAMYGIPAVAVQAGLVRSMVGAALCGLLAMTLVLGLAIILIWHGCTSQNIEISRGRFGSQTLKRILSFGSILALHSVIGMFFSSGQKVLIGFLFGPAAVSIYQVGYSIMSRVHSLVTAATEVMFPVASSADKSVIARIYVGVLVKTFCLAATLLGVLVVFSGQILTLWVGKEVANEVTPLMLPLAAAFLFVSLSALPFFVMNGYGRPIVAVVLGIANVIAFLILLAFGLSVDRSVFTFTLCYALANLLTGIVYQVFCVRTILQEGSKTSIASIGQNFE